jgi:hypothetical protein
MPCYDPRDRRTGTETVYVENKVNTNLQQQLIKANNLNNQLMGVLCAIDNELVSKGIAETIYAAAQRNGLIDIMSLIQQHRNDDTIRLQKDIMSRYSKHELNVIKKLIKQTN